MNKNFDYWMDLVNDKIPCTFICNGCGYYNLCNNRFKMDIATCEYIKSPTTILLGDACDRLAKDLLDIEIKSNDIK